MSEYGSWVYAVARELDADLLDGLTGVAGEPVRAVGDRGLSAVVGTVPLAHFGEEALRRNLEDLDWLAGVARVHDAVVTAVSRTVPAVPFRMTTVYFDDDRVAELLRDGASGFAETLDRVAGRAEWGVRALLDLSRMREPEPAAPAASGAGAAYLRRKRAERDTGQRIEQFAIDHADELHAAFTAFAVDARRNRPHAPGLADPNLPMILNGAYLVEDAAAAAFAEAVSAQDRRTEEIELRLSGPWPAYSFTAIGREP